MRPLLPLYAGVFMSLAFLAEPVSAEPPYIATCGSVRTFSEPTPTVPGSVTIGTATFALHSGDRLPSSTPVGALMCINQTVTTSGPVLALIAMPSPICGEVLGIPAGTRPERGVLIDIATTTPDLRIALPASASLGFVFPGRSTVACFEVGLDANGNALATRVMGATVTAPSAGPTPAPISGLPSTATGGTLDGFAAFVIGASAAILVLISRRRGRYPGR
ncbi:MAG TPA: hypothetical protein VEN31_09195 [Candidatus Bathyarchaeia archaeon]|nr:hypothetical protein [Candidatus Bathyarchaeia archaeon]